MSYWVQRDRGSRFAERKRSEALLAAQTQVLKQADSSPMLIRILNSLFLPLNQELSDVFFSVLLIDEDSRILHPGGNSSLYKDSYAWS